MLSVSDHPELQATSLALRAADRRLRGEINRATVAMGAQVWRPLLEANATSHQATRMLVVGARVKGGNPPVAMAANSRRGIGKTRRLVPALHYAGFEFGAVRGLHTRYTRRSASGGTHEVARRTMMGMPPRNRKGWVVFPAFAEIAPRMVRLWVQLTVRMYAEAAERRT